MKRIGIISDTHGCCNAMDACVSKAKDVDAWFHLGDYAMDANKLGASTGKQVYSVAGNCDILSDAPLELTVELEGLKLLLIHGHKYGVSVDDTYRACLRAEELNCNALFYGHTHVSEISNYGGLITVNPGSPSSPRSGRRPSFAIAELEDGRIRVKIVPVN